jgi:hypothetical protein
VGRALLNVPTLVLLEHAAEVRPALALDLGVRALAEVGLDAPSLLAQLDAAADAARPAEVSRALARAAIREAAAQRKGWLRDASTWGRTLRSRLALIEGELERSAARSVAGCLANNWGQRFDAARRSLATTLVTLRSHEPTLGLGPTHPVVVAGQALAARADALAAEQRQVTDQQPRATAAGVAARARSAGAPPPDPPVVARPPGITTASSRTSRRRPCATTNPAPGPREPRRANWRVGPANWRVVRPSQRVVSPNWRAMWRSWRAGPAN